MSHVFFTDLLFAVFLWLRFRVLLIRWTFKFLNELSNVRHSQLIDTSWAVLLRYAILPSRDGLHDSSSLLVQLLITICIILFNENVLLFIIWHNPARDHIRLIIEGYLLILLMRIHPTLILKHLIHFGRVKLGLIDTLLCGELLLLLKVETI